MFYQYNGKLLQSKVDFARRETLFELDKFRRRECTIMYHPRGGHQWGIQSWLVHRMCEHLLDDVGTHHRVI
jgi:uncharacterized protein (DUF2126 family)